MRYVCEKKIQVDIECALYDLRSSKESDGGEKLCGVELEGGGGECHVREELVGVTRTMATVRERERRRERGAMNTLVVRLSFSPRPST